MPYCKSVAIHGHVDKTLSYILDPDKTEELLYTTSINCMTDTDLAYTQMKTVYEQYARRSYEAPAQKNGKSAIKAIHYIISFADSENVTPELAHKIAKALVRKNSGEDTQAVIATHTNTDHVHCHILVNSCSLSGKRFYDNKKSLRMVRENTNGVCRAFGITPALNFENKGRSMSYYEWTCKKNGVSWKEHIRNAIDSLIPSVNSFDELLSELESQGFTVKRDKHVYIKAPGQQRSVSLWKLGDDYTEESLKSRILWRAVGNIDDLHFTNTEIERAYIDVLGEVRFLADERRKVPRRYDINRPYGADNDLDCYRLSAQIAVMNWDRITSISDLKNRIIELSAEIKKEQEDYSAVLLEHERVPTLLEQAEYYYANSGRDDLSAEEFNRLQTYRTAVYQNNIMTEYDRILLKQKNEKLQRKISDMKEKLMKKRNKLVRYVDIRDTYERISKRDYVEELVAEEKHRREQEEQKRQAKYNKRR